MPKFTKFLFTLFLFWLLVFNLHRLVFLVAFARGLGASQWVGAFTHSLSLDLSAAAYFSIVPFLLGFIALFVDGKTYLYITHAIKTYLIMILVLLCLVQAGDISVYPEWQVKLPYKALEHLRHPLEPILTASPLYILAFFGTLVFELLTGIMLYKWLVKRNVPQGGNQLSFVPVLLWLLIGGIIFLFIRGGWGQFPISASAAYFSDKSVLNDASQNSAWQFGGEVWSHFDRDDSKLYHYMPDEEAERIFKTLYPQAVTTDSGMFILKNKRPNIVVLLLESWSADVVGRVGEFKGMTPGFDSLAKEGLLFNNFYANSWMSEKGNVAVFSGMPSLPTVSIFDRPAVFRRMPSINQPLQQVGYHSSYYYGGYLDFGNIRGYLLDHDFQKIVDRNDIGSLLPSGKLGVHDGDMLPYFLSQLNQQVAPFFSVLFTLSTHLPYDIPGHQQDIGGGEVKPYEEAIKYSDKALAFFFREAKKQKWYNNTLFILVSDHSHATAHYREPWEKDRFRIPMLFVGPVIKDELKGRQIDKLASQMDIASTLLSQLGIAHKQFAFSKDFMSDRLIDFVPYAFSNGCGWIDSCGFSTWDVKTGIQLNTDIRNQSGANCVQKGKGFFQALKNRMFIY